MFVDILNHIGKSNISLKWSSVKIEKSWDRPFNFIENYNDKVILEMIKLYPYITDILNIILIMQKREINRNSIIEKGKEKIYIAKMKNKEKYLEKIRQRKPYNPKITIEEKINWIKEKINERLNTFDEKTDEIYENKIDELNNKLELDWEEKFDFFWNLNYMKKVENPTKIYLNNYINYIDWDEENLYYEKMFWINNIYFIFSIFSSLQYWDKSIQPLFIDILNKINFLWWEKTINNFTKKAQKILNRHLWTDLKNKYIKLFINLINNNLSIWAIYNNDLNTNFWWVKNNITEWINSVWTQVINKFIDINMYYNVYLFKYLFYDIEYFNDMIYDTLSDFLTKKFVDKTNKNNKITKSKLEKKEDMKKIILWILKISYMEYYLIYKNKIKLNISDMWNISYIIWNIWKKEVSLIDFIINNKNLNNFSNQENETEGIEWKNLLLLNTILNKIWNSIIEEQKLYLNKEIYNNVNYIFFMYFNSYLNSILTKLKEEENIILEDISLDVEEILENEDNNESEDGEEKWKSSKNKYATSILNNNYSLLFRIKTNKVKYLWIKYNLNKEDKKIDIYNIYLNRILVLNELWNKILKNKNIQKIIIKTMLWRKNMNFKYKKYKIKKNTTKLISIRKKYLMKNFNNEPENKLIKNILEDIIYNNDIFLPTDIPWMLFLDKIPFLLSMVYDKKNEFTDIVKKQAMKSVMYHQKLWYYLPLFLIHIKPIKSNIYEINFNYKNIDVAFKDKSFKLFNDNVFDSIFTWKQIPTFLSDWWNIEIKYANIKYPIIEEIKLFIKKQWYKIIEEDKLKKNRLSQKIITKDENWQNINNNSLYIQDDNFDIKVYVLEYYLNIYLKKLLYNIIVNNFAFLNVEYFLKYMKAEFNNVPIFYFTEEELKNIKTKNIFNDLKDKLKQKIRNYLFILKNRETWQVIYDMIWDKLFNINQQEINTEDLTEETIFNWIKQRINEGVEIKDFNLLIFDTYKDLINEINKDEDWWWNFINENKDEIYKKIISYIIKDYILISNKLLKYYIVDENIQF